MTDITMGKDIVFVIRSDKVSAILYVSMQARRFPAYRKRTRQKGCYRREIVNYRNNLNMVF